MTSNFEEPPAPAISIDDVKELFAPEADIPALRAEAQSLHRIDLTEKQLCDLELLLIGGFRPLDGFMREDDYLSSMTDMRLSARFDRSVWPMPITLDVPHAIAVGTRVGLWDPDENRVLAVMTVESCWTPDKVREAVLVFGKDDRAHPSVAYLHDQTHGVYVGGAVLGIALPNHYDFTELRRTPRQLRAHFRSHGWPKVVAFQTRNPMHRSHRELTVRASVKTGASLLIQPVVGRTKPGDVDHFTRVRCYKKMLAHYPATTVLSLLPLAMRMGGPREALWHALIRRNYGCTHFIVGRDHAGPGNDSNGQMFYDPYGAQVLVAQFAAEIGIAMVPFKEIVYVESRREYAAVDEVDEKAESVLRISGTELRRRLFGGLPIPDWFSFPEVIDELRLQYPPRLRQGLVLALFGELKSIAVFGKGLQHVLTSRGRVVTIVTRGGGGVSGGNLGGVDDRVIKVSVEQLVRSGGTVVLMSAGKGEDLYSEFGGLFEVMFEQQGIRVLDKREKMEYKVEMGIDAAVERPRPFVEAMTKILDDSGFLLE